MTNYEKYAGDTSRLADLVMSLEEGIGGLSAEFCTERCMDRCGKADCTDENMRQCIVDWLKQEAGTCAGCMGAANGDCQECGRGNEG